MVGPVTKFVMSRDPANQLMLKLTSYNIGHATNFMNKIWVPNLNELSPFKSGAGCFQYCFQFEKIKNHTVEVPEKNA